MNILWQSPERPAAALVLAHGTGADMTHRTMQSLAEALARRGIAALRFNVPFIDARRRRVDLRSVSTATIAETCEEAGPRTLLPLWIDGDSFGGRMASHAVLDDDIAPRGLIFCSFPLHPSGSPATARAMYP